MQQEDDFRGAAGIQAGGDFIAEEQGRVVDPFHSQAEAPLLSARKNGDPVVDEVGEAGHLQGFIGGGFEFRPGQAGAQADGVFDAFIYS